MLNKLPETKRVEEKVVGLFLGMSMADNINGQRI